MGYRCASFDARTSFAGQIQMFHIWLPSSSPLRGNTIDQGAEVCARCLLPHFCSLHPQLFSQFESLHLSGRSVRQLGNKNVALRLFESREFALT